MSSDKLQEIIDLEKQGYRATAIRRLRRYLENHPESAEGWYFLARFETEPRLQKIAIDRVIALKPDDEQAREFQSILLEEYPDLEQRSSRLARILVILVLVAGVGISAFFGLQLLQDQPQEVVVIVPTQTSPPTVAPIVPVEAPADTPETITETPEFNISVATNTPPPTIDVTPIPSVTPSSVPTIPAVAPAESQIVRLAIEDGGENLAAQFADMLSAQFDARTLFFEPSAEPVSDPVTQDDAALVIYGAASPEQISLTLSGQEKSDFYLQEPDLLALRRMDVPWRITLNIPRAEMEDSAVPGSLIGAAAYVGYQHQKVIESLAPLFETPMTLDESQSRLVFMLAYSYQALGQHEDALRVYEILNTNSTV
ncbi:MAG TPA: hypothetical protein VJZ27_20765, partial [Aggregatilineales bacterium]|nr:hypothetical protein [Aggregatilineales bacterium]